MEYPKIDGLYLSKLANEPLNYLVGRIAGVLRADGSPERDWGEKLEEDRFAFEALIRRREPVFGSTLKEIDKNVDRYWRGLKTLLKLNLEHPEASVRAAAEEIWPVFNNLQNPTRKPYAEEYGALSVLLQKLDQFGVEKLEAAQALSWVEALRGAVNAFKEKQESNSHAKVVSDVGQTKRARDQMLERYSEICARLNAMMVLMPDEAHAQLIAQINQRVDEYRLSQKLSVKKKKTDAPAPQA